MVIAQAAGQYGALAAAFSAVTTAWATFEEEARRVEPTTWVFIAIAVVGIWFFMRR